jgi:transcriptional regulator with XRE-family HTH domain
MNSAEQSLTRSYSQEDVQQILNIALAEYPHSDTELSYKQLLEIADELRISPDTLKLAETSWLTKQSSTEKFKEFELHRRSKFQDRLGRYFVVNTCLVTFNLLVAGGLAIPWSLWILSIWSIPFGLSAWKFLYQRQGQAYERAFKNWERKSKIHKSITGLIDKLV